MNLRNIIPKNIKIQFQVLKRFWLDRNLVFSKESELKVDFNFSISTVQEMKKGVFFENKVHNISKGYKKVENIIIKPNEIFSFWKIVGKPNSKNNFRTGRNIIQGKISEEIGGGLCQLSSIIYVTALKTNLEIVERFNHSVDIYKEEERFTPLGADATIVFGYKDLRIKNNYLFPVKFSFEIIENQIFCKLLSKEKIDEFDLDFIRNYSENEINVSTTKNGVYFCESVYKL
jgi:vancomycin resistance protein VanW